MNVTPEVCKPNAWLALSTASRRQLRAVNHYFDRRHLDAALATLVEAARTHEANGLPAGSPLFVVLNTEAKQLCEVYCQRWEVAMPRLAAQLPALDTLHKLATPTPLPAQASRLLLVVVAVMAASFLLGLAGAVMQIAYHLLGGGR
jgi:hypothetical protein